MTVSNRYLLHASDASTQCVSREAKLGAPTVFGIKMPKVETTTILLHQTGTNVLERCIEQKHRSCTVDGIILYMPDLFASWCE